MCLIYFFINLLHFLSYQINKGDGINKDKSTKGEKLINVYEEIFAWRGTIYKNNKRETLLKFIYSEKATKFCEIFILLLSYVVPVKSKVKISQSFVAFSEYMNFN